MKKQNKTVAALMMALAMGFGAQTTVSAQFGGLMNKAKSAVKDKVDNKAKMSKFETKDSFNQATKGSTSSQSNSDSESFSSSSSNSSSSSVRGGYKPQFDVDLSKAKHSDWDYTSGGSTVEADFAYWMQRLANSMASGKPESIDWEAAFRINTGKPSFDFLDNSYHLYDGEKLTDYNAEQWQFERKAILKRMQEIESVGIPESPNTDGLDKETKARKLGQYMVDKANAQIKRAANGANASARVFHFYRAFGSVSTGVTMKWISGSESGFSNLMQSMQSIYSEIPAEYKSDFPAKYDIASLQAFDAKRKEEAKAKKPNQEIMKMKKGALLTQYRTTQKKGETTAAFSGHVVWLEDVVKANCPEWGNVLASRVFSDYKVEVNALGVPLYRTFTSEVLCEDQGFRVVHEVFLKQDYAGGKYGKSEVRPGGLKWNAKCSVVK